MVMPMTGAGIFGMNSGIMAPMTTLVLHIAFGAVLGASTAPAYRPLWRIEPVAAPRGVTPSGAGPPFRNEMTGEHHDKRATSV